MNLTEERKQELIAEAKKRGFDYDTLFRWGDDGFIHKTISKDSLGSVELFTHASYSGEEYFGVAGYHHASHHCYNGILHGDEWSTVLESTTEINEAYRVQMAASRKWLSSAYKKHTNTTLEEVENKIK